jgi:hypothetical protein
MKILKKICWSKYENFDQIHFVSLKSYSLDHGLDVYFSNIPYNFPLWLSNTFNHPLPTGSNDASDIIQRLKSKSQFLPDSNTVIPSSGQELALYNIFKENKETGISNEKIRSLAIKIIKEQIIEKEKLPGLDVNVVHTKFQSDEAKTCADEILDESKISNIHNALRQVSMYQTACDLISRFEENYHLGANEHIINKREKYSAISRIILMQLETVQREQIVKLTQTCSVMFKTRPCLPNIQNVKVVSYDTILKNIALVNTEIRDKNYSQVLSELPLDWQQPIKYNVPLVQAKFEMLKETISFDNVAQAFEDRLGILLYNIAKESPKIYQNGGDYFPDWHIVQYILPCFVSGYLVESKMQKMTLYMCSSRPYGLEGSNEIGVQNYAKYIHEIIKYYEQCYNSWLQIPKQHTTKIIPEKEPELKSILLIYGLIIDKLREYVKLVVNAHIYKDAIYTIALTVFDPITSVLHITPFTMSNMFDTDYETDLLIKNWYDYTFDFFNTLLVVARQAWGPPIPGTIIPKCPKLGELFFANAIICEVDVVFDIIAVYKKKYTPCSKELIEMQCEMKQIRLDTYRKVINCKTFSKECLQKFVSEKKQRVLHFYKLLKQFYYECCPIERFRLFDKLPCNTFQPEVKNAVIFYMNGNFDALENLLTVFDFPIVKKCRKCSIPEAKAKSHMIVCDECIEQKYPDIHYFCSISCKDAYWQSIHMVDHLEFETGVSDLIQSDE